ncbi:MAG: TatD family hydrolase, partial [Candidatus Heimdallarchaeota archaeon]|nr:TatD family hydrolase [Candidatus Heimdallarchaeota archaeon]
MLIDTHCHLNFQHYDDDLNEVLNRAKESFVDYLINVGVDVSGCEQSIKLACEHDYIFATVGVHPHYALDVSDDEISQIKDMSQHDRVVAIGEIGLDYYNRRDPDRGIADSFKKIQQNVFRKFLILSKEENLPVIIHCRDAADDTMGIIKECLPVPVSGVMHCFSQDKKCLKQCLDLGLYISFTGNITYKAAGGLRDMVEYAPLEQMLIETDSPFLAPQEFRGRRNEPAYVKYVSEQIAQIKKISSEEVAKITSEN